MIKIVRELTMYLCEGKMRSSYGNWYAIQPVIRYLYVKVDGCTKKKEKDK